MYTDLPAPIKFGADKIVKIKVWSPKETTLTMKIEHPANPNAPASSGDNTVAIPVANEWVELSFDFSASPTPLPDDGDYDRITLIWDINNIPAADEFYYFDDVSLTGGECSTTSTNGPVRPEALSIAPNPVSDQLIITDLGNVAGWMCITCMASVCPVSSLKMQAAQQ